MPASASRRPRVLGTSLATGAAGAPPIGRPPPAVVGQPVQVGCPPAAAPPAPARHVRCGGRRQAGERSRAATRLGPATRAPGGCRPGGSLPANASARSLDRRPSWAVGLRRGRPFNVGRVTGGGWGRALRTARITSAAAVITRRVSWKRHSWCAAVGQISASSRGYSAEPSVMTCSGASRRGQAPQKGCRGGLVHRPMHQLVAHQPIALRRCWVDGQEQR